MAVIKGLEWTFDQEAQKYAKMRPGYLPELYEDLLAYLPLRPGKKALEIGIGGGQATLPVLQTGCALTAVEYGENFSRICREKFREFPDFSVRTGKFEEMDGLGNGYDLIYSASAFHWIPEEIGYRKVYAMLKPGGAFARFANHPYEDKGKPELSEAIQALYAVYMPGSQKPREYGEEDAKQRAEIAGNYGFAEISWHLYRRTRAFSAKEYTALLGTYSDHIALKPEVRREFFAEIEAVINRFGGQITLYDTLDLELARKPF